MDRSKQYPGFWHAVLLCVTFVALQMFLITPFEVLDVVFKVHLVSNPTVLGAINLSACAVVMVMGWLIGKPAMRDVLAFRRVSAATVLAVMVATTGAMILVSEMDNLVRLVLPPPEWIVRLFSELLSSAEHPWGSLFVLVIVAPLTEEVMFRGLILRGFLRRFSPLRAFLLSAMLFAAVHLNPWQSISALSLGLMFAWWYARTRSLVPSLLGHAVANGVVAVHQWLPFEVRGFNAGEPFASVELQPLWFDLLGVLLLAAGMWLFRSVTPSIGSHGERCDRPESLSDTPVCEAPPIIPPDGAEKNGLR
jgi:hypothetical protein